MQFSREVLEAERDRRAAIFEKIMKDNNLDGLYFTSTAQPAYQMGAKYASGYTLSSRRDIVYVVPGELPYLVLPTVGQQSSAQKVSFLPADHILSDDLDKATEKFVRSLGGASPRIGVYEPNEVPAILYHALNCANAEFVDITYQLTCARQNKSDFELTCIRESSRIACSSVDAVVKALEPGKSEREIVGVAEGFVRAHGGEDSLILIRAQKPHTFISRASDRPIAEDGVFVYSVEMAGIFGYWTQCVRPIFMNYGVQPEAYRILGIIKEAEAAGREAFKPGNRVCDVAEAIEKVIADHKLNVGVWSGHGMGADLGDCVDIGASNKMEIVPNMILTMHPSVFSAEDGLLYGNTFVCTEKGAECLTPDYADVPYLPDLKKLVK